MNFWYTGFLIAWCVLIIGNCYQGQNLITPNNIDSNIYIYFQVLSTTTSVMLAIIIACNICINYCNQDKWESDDFLAFVIFPLTIVQITMFGLIGTNIEAVSGDSDTKNFTIILSVCGGISGIPLFYSLYKIIKYLFPTPEEMVEREKRKESSKIAQLKRHELQEALDLRNADKQHKLQLEHEHRQLQRQNELIIQEAKEEVFTKNQLLAKQKAENAAKRALEEQILEAERTTEMLAEDKRAREASVNIDRMRRQEKLRIEALERDRRQKDFDEETEMRKLRQDKENKELEESRERRKLRQNKNLEESLYKKNLERQRQQQIEEEELSLKEIKRLKDVATYNRDQAMKKLQLARIKKESSQQINDLQEEISKFTKEINDLSPGGKDKDSTIAELPPDGNEEECKEMSETLSDMKQCHSSAQQHRDYYHSKRDTLTKYCANNYKEMDEYEEKCQKDKKCNILKTDLDRGKLEDCNNVTAKFKRKGYKIGDYDHCTNEIQVLDKIIEKCNGEEKYGDSSGSVQEAPLRRWPKIESTMAQLPESSTSDPTGVGISVMRNQNPDDHEAFNLDVQQKNLVPVPPLSPGPQPSSKYSYLDRTLESIRNRSGVNSDDLDNEDMYQDENAKFAIDTCRHITENNEAFNDCSRGRDMRKIFLQMDPKIREKVRYTCPANYTMIEETEKRCN